MTPTRRPLAAAATRTGDRLARALLATALLLAALVFAVRAHAQDDPAGTVTSHGLSVFGELKYPADFKHFDYVNPDAPKGGTHRTWSLGSYDSLTPFTEKGDAAAERLDRLRQPDGQLARQPRRRCTASSPRASPTRRTSAGSASRCAPRRASPTASPLTAEDVVFTFDMMKNKGQLRYRAYFGDIEKVEALGPHEVKFTFAEGAAVRDLLPTVGQHLDLLQGLLRGPRLHPRLHGPAARLRRLPGRPRPTPAAPSIYTRDPDYWAKDLPVNVGANNFDTIQYRLLRRPDQRLRGASRPASTSSAARSTPTAG